MKDGERLEQLDYRQRVVGCVTKHLSASLSFWQLTVAHLSYCTVCGRLWSWWHWTALLCVVTLCTAVYSNITDGQTAALFGIEGSKQWIAWLHPTSLRSNLILSSNLFLIVPFQIVSVRQDLSTYSIYMKTIFVLRATLCTNLYSIWHTQ
jgi:hypothetical protein